jgi:hypothetical protein
VEELIWSRRRLQQVVVDPATRYRVENRLARGPVTQVAPLDQKSAIGMGMEVVCLSNGSLPVVPESDWPARINATSSPAFDNASNHSRACVADGMARTRIMPRVAIIQFLVDVPQRIRKSSSTARITGESM